MRTMRQQLTTTRRRRAVGLGALLAAPAAALAMAVPSGAADVGPAAPTTVDPGVDPAVIYKAPPVVIVRRTFITGRFLNVRLSCPRNTGGCRAVVRSTIRGNGLNIKLPTLTKRLRANRAPAFRMALSASQRRRIRAARPSGGVRSLVTARSGGGKTFRGRYVTRLIR